MMKPRLYLLGLVVLSSLAIALICFSPGRGVDAAPMQTQREHASAEPPLPATAAERQPPSLNQKDENDALRREADPLAELNRRLDDPRQRETNLLRAKLNVKQSRGRIFQRLRNLPPETLDHLKDILAGTQLAMERGALPDRALRLHSSYASTKFGILGPSDY